MDWVVNMLIESAILAVICRAVMSTEKTKKQKELIFLLRLTMWLGIGFVIIALVILLVRLIVYLLD
jgi:hypothetical protein